MPDATHAVPGSEAPAGPPGSDSKNESDRREQDITRRNDGNTESTTGDIPGGSTTVAEQHSPAAPLHRPGADDETVDQGPADPAGPVDQAGEDPPGHTPGEDDEHAERNPA